MNKHAFLISIFVALLVLAVAGVALAQSDAPLAFDISWFSIDGGGGSSAGGSYTVNGSIGQPDAGYMSGGSYTISGGFWAGGGPTQQRVYLPWVKR